MTENFTHTSLMTPYVGGPRNDSAKPPVTVLPSTVLSSSPIGSMPSPESTGGQCAVVVPQAALKPIQAPIDSGREGIHLAAAKGATYVHCDG